MDSQENALVNASPVEEQGKTEELNQAATAPEVVTETPEAPVAVEETAAEAAPAPAEEPPVAEETPVEETPVPVEEAPAAEEAPIEEVPVEEEASQVVEEQRVYETKQEVLERVKELAHGDETPKKEEVDYLKTTFYKLHIAEREAKL
jgi:hypothetical protein